MDDNFADHKRTIELEYQEFFKSRQRIRAEWSMYIQKTSQQVDSLVDSVVEYDSHLQKMNGNDSKLADMIIMVLDSTEQQSSSKGGEPQPGKLLNQKLPPLNSDIENVRSKIRYQIDQLYSHPKILNGITSEPVAKLEVVDTLFESLNIYQLNKISKVQYDEKSGEPKVKPSSGKHSGA